MFILGSNYLRVYQKLSRNSLVKLLLKLILNVIQWNIEFKIWQGDSKIISLNRDIVVN